MLQLAHGQQLLAIQALTKIYRGKWILVESTISTASQSCLKNMMVTVRFKIFLFKIKKVMTNKIRNDIATNFPHQIYFFFKLSLIQELSTCVRS